MALVYSPHLMQLSDDVLLHMISFLTSYDILVLSKVCTRLNKICGDRTLWHRADFRPNLLTLTELKKAVKFFHRGTKFLGTTGSLKKRLGKPGWNTECLSPALLQHLSYNCNLTTLILEEHFIDAVKLPFSSYPSTLNYFSLENCELANVPLKQSYFYNMSTTMPNLETLILNGCKWFEDHSLMSISKCSKLKTLRIRNCPKVGSCAAYILLAARFGFESLEVLDLRGTGIGDGEVHAFQSKSTLKQFYLDGSFHRKQCSHELDRVTDRGVYVLGGSMPRLRILTVTNTEISDVTLRHLKRNLPGLEMLDVRGSKVTESGVLKLKSELPDMKIFCDFSELSSPVSDISVDSLIDTDFVFQEEIPKPIAHPVAEEPQHQRHERIQILFVEPGMVRLRRVVEPEQAAERNQPQPNVLEEPINVIDRVIEQPPNFNSKS